MSFYPESFAIDDLPINPTLTSKLKKASFLHCKKLLNFSLTELQRIAKISPYEANIVYEAACLAQSKSIEVDALSMLNTANASKENLKFEFFNSSLFEGIYTGTITEIFGESGVGKTQLCLLLSIYALMPGNFTDASAKVLYIHSEGEFPIQRFVELSKSFKKKHPLHENVNFLDNMILKKVYNLKETIRVLRSGISELFQQNNLPKVIIIDSVAELLRGEYDSFNLRNLMIQQLAVELWRLAHTHKVAVICINQVSGSMQKCTTSTSVVSTDVPSLGLMWANVLTTRIKVFRKGFREETTERALEVVYSSYHPRLVIYFLITNEGFETLDEFLL